MNHHASTPKAIALTDSKDTHYQLSIDDITDGLNHEPDDTDDFTWDELTCDIVDEATEIEMMEPIITIGEAEIMHRASLIVLSGKPKSRKSTLGGIVTAGAIRDKDMGNIAESMYVTPNGNRYAVIYVDNENPKRRFQKNVKSILKMAGYDNRPDYFYPVHYRSYSKTDRRKRLDALLRKVNKRHSGIYLIILDGITDFINDTNDLAECTEVVTWVNTLQDEYTAGVMVIVHTNKTSSSERGHIGSELQRKTDGLIRVINDGKVSRIEPDFLREALPDEVPVFSFRQDDATGYPVSMITDEMDESKYLRELLYAIYGDDREYRWGDAIDAIRKHTGKGRQWAIERQKELRLTEWIFKTEGRQGKWRMNTA